MIPWHSPLVRLPARHLRACAGSMVLDVTLEEVPRRDAPPGTGSGICCSVSSGASAGALAVAARIGQRRVVAIICDPGIATSPPGSSPRCLAAGPLPQAPAGTSNWSLVRILAVVEQGAVVDGGSRIPGQQRLRSVRPFTSQGAGAFDRLPQGYRAVPATPWRARGRPSPGSRKALPAYQGQQRRASSGSMPGRL